MYELSTTISFIRQYVRSIVIKFTYLLHWVGRLKWQLHISVLHKCLYYVWSYSKKKINKYVLAKWINNVLLESFLHNNQLK